MKLNILYKSSWILPALKVALIVGTLLFGINHGKAVYEGQMTAERWVSVFLSYLVPYCVYIVGKDSNKKAHNKRGH